MIISVVIVIRTFAPLYYAYILFNKTINNVSELIKVCVLQDPPTTDLCTILPAAGYYIHAFVTYGNGDVRIYTSNRIDGGVGDSMRRFNVSYNESFDQELEPNANYDFVVNIQNNVIEIPRTDTSPSCGKYIASYDSYSVYLTL